MELKLKPEEKRKDLRVIEYNTKTKELTVETGMLDTPEEQSAAVESKSIGTAATGWSYGSATYKSWTRDPVWITVNSLSTTLNWNYNYSSVGPYNSNYQTYAYRGITTWWLYYPVTHSQSVNSSYAKANTSASFKNTDFMTSAPTYADYENNQVRGYYDGSAYGSCSIYLSGECYWMLSYSSSLIRNI